MDNPIKKVVYAIVATENVFKDGKSEEISINIIATTNQKEMAIGIAYNYLSEIKKRNENIDKENHDNKNVYKYTLSELYPDDSMSLLTVMNDNKVHEDIVYILTSYCNYVVESSN